MELSAETCTQLCPRFHTAVELIGKRWNGAIVQLLLGGPVRFHDLRRGIPEISDKMLSERLKELETAAIVARRVIPDTPVRVEYSLTPKGQALAAPLAAISDWAETWLTAPEGVEPEREPSPQPFNDPNAPQGRALGTTLAPNEP